MTQYKRIPDWNQYLASSDGRIFSIKNMKFIKDRFTRRGYKEVKLSKNGKSKTRLVHRLIASAFFGKSDLSVDHKNFIKDDNNIENLRYITALENHKMAVQNNKIRSGSNHFSATLTKEQVLDIRNSKLTRKELALKHKVPEHRIYLVKTMRSYKNG